MFRKDGSAQFGSPRLKTRSGPCDPHREPPLYVVLASRDFSSQEVNEMRKYGGGEGGRRGGEWGQKKGRLNKIRQVTPTPSRNRTCGRERGLSQAGNCSKHYFRLAADGKFFLKLNVCLFFFLSFLLFLLTSFVQSRGFTRPVWCREWICHLLV